MYLPASWPHKTHDDDDTNNDDDDDTNHDDEDDKNNDADDDEDKDLLYNIMKLQLILFGHSHLTSKVPLLLENILTFFRNAIFSESTKSYFFKRDI